MASPGITLLKKVGTDISGPGRFNRDAVLLALAIGDREKLVPVLKQVAEGGERSAELMLIEPVAKLMGHQEPEVCAAAVEAMGRMGASAAAYAEDIAEYILKHPSALCRATALGALGRLGAGLPTGARQAVAGCVADSEASVRRAAVDALRELQATDQARTMRTLLLEDPSPSVRAAALEALAFFVSASEEAEGVCPPESLCAPIAELLSQQDSRCGALRAVEYMGERAPMGCAAPVARALADPDGPTRLAAASALGALGASGTAGGDALREVEALLTSPAPGARAAAAYAAGLLGREAESLSGAVAALLEDGAEDDAALASQMGSATQRLPPELRVPRCAALTALGRLGAHTHSGAASAALGDASWEVRLAACEALGHFGEAAKGSTDALVAALEDDAFPVRAAACAALGASGQAQALPNLVEKFEDSSHSVRLGAVTAVGRFEADSAEYSHDVFKLLNDPISQVKAAAITALSRMGDIGRSYTGVIGTMMCEEDPQVRCAALYALGCMGAHGAALASEIAERSARDRSASVREAATWALDSLSSETELHLPTSADSGLEGRHAYAGAPEMLAGHRPRFEGLGLYYAEIQERKKELQQSGQWIEGIF